MPALSRVRIPSCINPDRDVHRSTNVWVIVLVCACAAIGMARLALDIEHGLAAEYFDELDPRAERLFRMVDSHVSTAQVTASWLDNPPVAFRVRWSGYLNVREGGRYTFALRSDDGSTLSVDGQMTVDNGGRHAAQVRAGTIQLDEGPHAIRIEFANEVGGFDLDWSWAHEGAVLAPIPSWLLTPRRAGLAPLVTARALDWLLWAVLAATAVAVAPGCVRVARATAGRFPRAAALVFFIALTLAETWPLAAHPARLSRNDNGDTVVNEWTIAWVAHQAPRDPLHLYAANIFYPRTNTLAYSESMLVQAAMGAPLAWLGASPVLTYNVVLMLGFALTGWTMCLAIQRWTGDWSAGLVSGLLLAFNAHSFTRLPHLQALHAEFLPLSMVALDAVLRDPRVGHALRLGMYFTLQALTSVYLLVFTASAMAAAALVRPETWWGRRFTPVVSRLLLAAIVSAIVLFPYLLPYWTVYRQQGVATGAATATSSGAIWAHYLGTPSRIDYAVFSHKYFAGVALFPGVIGLVLTALALGTGQAFRDARARMCLRVGVCGLALSFGNKTPGYAALHRVLPLLQAVRDVPRFGYLVIFAVSALAGFGVVGLRARIHRGWWPWCAATLLAAIALETAVAPIRFTRFEGVPSIYSQLRDVASSIVIEMPIYDRIAAFHNAPYLLNSTAHWKPMVNGYIGFEPTGYRETVDECRYFPAERGVAAMQAAGITHVFVHLRLYGEGIVDTIDANPAFHQLARKGEIVLYRLDPPGAQP